MTPQDKIELKFIWKQSKTIIKVIIVLIILTTIMKLWKIT
jgi:hypothetical protein